MSMFVNITGTVGSVTQVGSADKITIGAGGVVIEGATPMRSGDSAMFNNITINSPTTPAAIAPTTDPALIDKYTIGLAAYIELGNQAEAINMVAKGARVNQKNAAGDTMLIHALRADMMSLVAVLATHPDILINDQNNKGMTALHTAARMNDDEGVKILIDNKANTAMLNAEGKRAVDIASERGFASVVATISAATPTQPAQAITAKPPKP